MRILQAPQNIANQAWLMAEGLRARGHEVEVWQYGSTAFDYPADRTIDVAEGDRVYLDTLWQAIEADFDVVHFHFAGSLIPQRSRLPWLWDLPLWRALGVTVVFTFHGTDIRQRSHHVADDEWSFYRFADIPCDETMIEARLAVIRRYAQVMTVGSVLDLPYAPEARYLPKLIDTAGLVVPAPSTRSRPVVAHAPSKRATKGTDAVLAGLDALRARGHAFEVDLIEGVSNAEALTRMASADIVVEKLLGGDAGVTSLEAMALGKVAVARIRDEVRAQHPTMPVVSATPDSFVEVMSGLLADPDRRRETGLASRAYVEQDHAPERIAATLEKMYTGGRRAGIPAYPGWTVPFPEQEAEAMRVRVETAEARSSRLDTELQALRQEAKQARQRRKRLTQELAEARTLLAEASRRPSLRERLSELLHRKP